jgi:hypothetical protein
MGMGEFGVVRSKIPKELQSQLTLYCEREGITQSRFIRDLVQEKVAEVAPINKAGLNRITYDKKTDSFTWLIEYDDRTTRIIAEHVPADFFKNLSSELISSLSLRESYMKKGRRNSVPVPAKMTRLKAVK